MISRVQVLITISVVCCRATTKKYFKNKRCLAIEVIQKVRSQVSVQLTESISKIISHECHVWMVGNTNTGATIQHLQEKAKKKICVDLSRTASLWHIIHNGFEICTNIKKLKKTRDCSFSFHTLDTNMQE